MDTADIAIESALQLLFQRSGYRVLAFRVGNGSRDQIMARDPDAFVLDIAPPELRGLQQLVQLRTWSPAPIIAICADDSEDTIVAALDRGADDYLAKPLRPRELLARLRAALRRTARSVGEAGPAPFRLGDIVVDLCSRTVTLREAPVQLTKRSTRSWPCSSCMRGRSSRWTTCSITSGGRATSTRSDTSEPAS